MAERNEARELLTSLTVQLRALNTNLQQQTQIQAQRMHTEQALANYMAHLSSRVVELIDRLDATDALARQSDARLAQLDRRMAQLVQVLQGEESLPLPTLPQDHVPSPFTPGQLFGGVAGQAVDYLYRNRSGRGRRR